MRFAPSHVLAVLLAGLLAFAGCAPGETFEETILKFQAKAESVESYAMTRRYTDYAGSTQMSYVERFVSAADGRTKVELLKLNGKTKGDIKDPFELAEFKKLVARLGAGQGTFVATTRDFRVRDFVLALDNYQFILQDDVVNVKSLGRKAYLWDVWPKYLAYYERPSYRVWIDHETLLPLRYIEFLPNGVKAAEMTVLSLDLDVNISKEEFPPQIDSGQIEITEEDIGSYVNFTVFKPAYVPHGFQQTSLRFTSIQGAKAVTRTFTDGVQEIFLSQHPVLETTVLPEGFPENVPLRVSATMFGAASWAYFALDGTEIHVITKLNHSELMSFLEGLQ